MWNNETQWRQGSVIKVEILRNYNPGLVRSLKEDITFLCAVSCDGDIINDNMVLEPVVEFVGGKSIESASPEFTYAKHPSLLHLECFFEGKLIVLELGASPKIAVSKHNLIPAMQPDKSFSLDDNAKATLQNWLSYRYRRLMLPPSFVARTLPLWDYMKNEGKKYATHAMGFWVDYDPKGEVLSGGVPYTFSLYIVYSSRHHDAQEQGEKLALEIRNRFPEWREEAALKGIGDIELNECRAYADDCFTLADLRNCVQFSLEQINYSQASQALKGSAELEV